MASAKTLKRSLIRSFVVAAILPLLVVSVLVLYDLTGERARDIDEKNLLLAKAASGQIEGFLREPQATLRSIGDILLSHPTMTVDETQALLDTIVKNSELFESIYIIDATGTTRLIGLDPERVKQRDDFLGVSFSHLPFFQQSLESGEPAWSDTFFSVISGEMSLAVTQLIGDGVLVGNFSIRPLTEFIKNLHTTETIAISVVDRNGNTIAHPDPAFASQQIHVGHLAPVREALTGEENTRHYQFNQQEFIGSSVLIPGPNWAILVAQTTADAYHQVRFTGILLAAGAMGALLLSVLFSLTKAGNIAKPLSALTTQTDIIAGGGYDISFANSGYTEFNNLASNFNHMASAIRDREEELTKSRERYRLLVETMTDGLAIIDPNGLITYANPGLSRMTRYSSAEIIGRHIFDFFDNHHQALAKQQLELCQNGYETPYDIEWICQNGETIITTMSPKGLFEEGDYIGSFAVISDITSRKKTEILIREALNEAEEARDKIDAILKSVPLGLIVTDMQGRMILYNRSAEETLGHKIDEMQQQPVTAILQDTTFLHHLRAVTDKRDQEQQVDLELFDHGRGEVRTVQVSISRVQSQANVQTGIIIILNDVTGERESDRMKSEFIATAAHELSTPLTAIMGYAELLLKQEELGTFPPEQLHEFYTTILDRGEALSRITEDLLHLSHMESGRSIQLDKRGQIIEETIFHVAGQHRKESPGHNFVIDLDERNTVVPFDRGRMIQVLENLIGNAVKYTPPGGEISIAGSAQPGFYQFSVCDNGIGMTEEQTRRIFEKFYRANPLNSSISGLGMGMSIVKSIIDAHDGQIEVESAPDLGTRVRVKLPLK